MCYATGGTTPSIGMLSTIKKNIKIPVFVMLRPRAGDFLYTDEEYQVIEEDLKCLKESGADGFALGLLTADGKVDQIRCKQLIELCHPLPVTFHRAFDMTKSPCESLEAIIQLGCRRVLTSGCDTSVLEGLPLIVKLVQQAGDRISVVPAGGITERNISRIIAGLGRPQAVFHCSGRTTEQSRMIYRNTTVSMGSNSVSEYTIKVACPQRLLTILTDAKIAASKIT